MSQRDESFRVYCAGEQINGTDISILYIYVVTPIGIVRMTEDEAEELGRLLTHAAEYNRELETSEDDGEVAS